MKTCALVCGANFAREDFCERHARAEFDCVVAVDSGYAHLKQAGVRADVCLGDFDSLGFVPKGAVVHPAIKDKSDLELAIEYAIEQGFSDLIVYGCLGDRIDHTISALQVLAAAAEGAAVGASAREQDGVREGNCVRIRAVGAVSGTFAHDIAHANARAPYTEVLEVLRAPATLSFSVSETAALQKASNLGVPESVAPQEGAGLGAVENATPQEVKGLGAPTFGGVSVFSASPRACGVSTHGMYYELHDADLSNRTSLGLSNELIQHTGSVSAKSGTLFVVYPSIFCAELVEESEI